MQTIVKYIEVENYCENICRCAKEKCDKDKCPIWTAPAADVAEVKHGRWFKTYKGGHKYGCSVCNKTADLSKQGKEYCSYCGAKMEGERNSE